jgi:hypothetical protein
MVKEIKEKVLEKFERMNEGYSIARVEFEHGIQQYKIVCSACLRVIYYLPSIIDDVDDVLAEVFNAIDEHYTKYQCS